MEGLVHISVEYAMKYSKFQPCIDLQELIEELGIYFLFFDRAGYGDSDPNPKRSVKSEAFDIQELADKLQIGSKFYVLGVSMGAYPIWGCLKYIPNRHDAPTISFMVFFSLLLGLSVLVVHLLLAQYLQIVWSCPGSTICTLLVALFSFPASKRGLQDIVCAGPVGISGCIPCPMVVLLVDDSKMVPFIEYHGREHVNFQPARFRDVEKVVRNPIRWSGT